MSVASRRRWRAKRDRSVETVTLRDPVADVEATFAPGAGMVCCSLRHEGEELLAQNDGLEACARTGATMGIPFEPMTAPANALATWAFELAPYAATFSVRVA